MAGLCNIMPMLIILGVLMVSATAQQLVPAIFVFGDSLVDVGNNNYLPFSLAKADFPHNGVDYPDEKPTGRFTNGYNAADILAQRLGFPASPPPYLSLSDEAKLRTDILKGVNFGSGSSGILNSTGSNFVERIPLYKQIQYYETIYGNLGQQLGASATEKLVSQSLFFIVTGSNDMFQYSNQTYQKQQYVDILISTFKLQLQKLYQLGARRIALAAVGPVGCCPSRRSQNSKTGDCVEEENDLALAFNAALKSLLVGLSSSLQGMKYTIGTSTYDLVYSYIQNPEKYGFTEVKDACCGAGRMKATIPCLPVVSYCANRSNHVFWDLFHPTQIVYEAVTNSLFNGSISQASPVNVWQLVTN